MKAMIMDMCILSRKTQCFLMFGHVVGVGAGKLRGLPVSVLCLTRLLHNFSENQVPLEGEPYLLITANRMNMIIS